jgi:hypothetical protein
MFMTFGEDFQRWLTAELQQFANEFNTDVPRAFPAWWLTKEFDLDRDDAFNLTDTLQKGDRGIDGWFKDQDEQVLHIIQAKYSDDLEKTYSHNELGELHTGFETALNRPEEILGNAKREKLHEIVESIQSCAKAGWTIQLDWLLVGAPSEECKTIITGVVNGFRKGEADSILADFVDSSSLYDLWLLNKEAERFLDEKITISLAPSDNQSHYEVDCHGLVGVDKAAVCTLDARSLGQAYNRPEVKSRLFHRNVRYHLGRNKVNKGMTKTLETEPQSFWLYNNGITIVCQDFTFRDSPGRPACEVELTGPQIVNGAQTTVTLSKWASSPSAQDAAVQARIIKATSNDLNTDQVDNIALYTNSQSAVKDADLRGNDRVQIQIQRGFDSLNPPWFYERRRGEWQTLSPAARARYSNRRVKKEDIGSTYMAVLGKPARAVSDKSAIWTDEKVFSQSVSASTYVLAWQIFEYFRNDLRLESPSFTAYSNEAPNYRPLVYWDQMKRAKKLVALHLSAATWNVLTKRFSDINLRRSEELRRRFDNFLTDPKEQTFQTVIFAHVHNAFNTRLMNLELPKLKSILQSDTEFEMLKVSIDVTLASRPTWRDELPNIPHQR